MVPARPIVKSVLKTYSLFWCEDQITVNKSTRLKLWSHTQVSQVKVTNNTHQVTVIHEIWILQIFLSSKSDLWTVVDDG